MKKNLPRIDAVIIMKNAEGTISACLEAASEIADGIVVLDTGSTDKSLAIAECFTSRVYKSATDWSEIPFHFAQARNEALAYCECGPDNWVISIDADEVAVGAREAIREVLRHAGDGVDVLSVMNRTNTQLMWRMGMSDKVNRAFRGCRLFRNTGELFWQYRVHEQISRKDQKGIPNRPLPEDILYLMHQRDDITESLDRNLKLLLLGLEEERAAQERDPTGLNTGAGIVKFLIDLGQTYNDKGQFPEAVGAFQMVLSCLADHSQDIAGYVHYYIACSFYNFGALPPVIIHAAKSLKCNSRRRAAAILGASAAMKMKNSKAAVDFLRAAKSIEAPINEEFYDGQDEVDEAWIDDHLERLAAECGADG